MFTHYYYYNREGKVYRISFRLSCPTKSNIYGWLPEWRINYIWEMDSSDTYDYSLMFDIRRKCEHDYSISLTKFDLLDFVFDISGFLREFLYYYNMHLYTNRKDALYNIESRAVSYKALEDLHIFNEKEYTDVKRQLIADSDLTCGIPSMLSELYYFRKNESVKSFEITISRPERNKTAGWTAYASLLYTNRNAENERITYKIESHDPIKILLMSRFAVHDMFKTFKEKYEIDRFYCFEEHAKNDMKDYEYDFYDRVAPLDDY